MSNARSKATKASRDVAVWCKLCPPDNPSPAGHSHHLREISKGGPANGEQIALCTICHDDLHKALTAIEKGRESISLYESHTPQFRAALRIALDQRRKFALMTQGQKDMLDVGGTVSIELSAAEMRGLKTLKSRMGASSLTLAMKLLLKARLRKEGLIG